MDGRWEGGENAGFGEEGAASGREGVLVDCSRVSGGDGGREDVMWGFL